MGDIAAWTAPGRRIDRSFLHATGVAMVLTDPLQPDNPLVEVNDAFCALTGYPRSELYGRNCRFLQGAATRPEPVDVLRNAILERRSVLVELTNYRRNGTPFLNALLVGPVFDSEGNLVHFVGSQIETAKIPQPSDATRLLATLSAREDSVLRLLALGRANKEIALALDLSPRTVEMHRARLMKKLGAATLAQALRVLFEVEGTRGVPPIRPEMHAAPLRSTPS